MSKKKIKLPIFWIIAIGFLIFTYGRWESLTIWKGKEFTENIKKEAPTCYLYESQFEIDTVKVISLLPNKATTFLKTMDGNTYIIKFKKINAEWKVYYDGSCHYDIIKSATGGSADSWFWYW